MEIEIKRAVRAGNSSAVILPRSWLSKEVRVELIKKTPYKILTDVLDIIRKYVDLEEIIGIYIVGSYARKEETNDSDIDILIITANTDKSLIKEGIYSILMISKELLEQKLENDLFPIGQMIKEAKTLINISYLESLNIAVTKKNISWYLETTKEKLELLKNILEKTKNKIKNRVIYTLVLRIRTFYLIQKLIKKEIYSSKEFIGLINKISGSRNAYNSYLAIKNETEALNITAKDEANRLYLYLKKQLEYIEKIVI